MLKVPGAISFDELQAALEALPGICNVHHIHLWRVDDDDLHFEAHVDTEREILQKPDPSPKRSKNCCTNGSGSTT